MIFNDKVYLQIKQFQDDFYNEMSIDKDTYLKKCFEILNSTLCEKFKDDYIFGKLYYRNKINSAPDVISFFDNSKAKQSKSIVFSEGIKKLESLVLEKTSKSLSVVIIERFLRGIVLYKGCFRRKYRIPSVLRVDFGKPPEYFFNLINNYSIVVKSNINEQEQDGLVELLDGHSKMADASGLKNVFSYLIRTRTYSSDFNGVLYLVLKNELDIRDYSDIADLLTFILEKLGKYNSRPKVQQEEWQTLMQQQAHVNQSELKALRNMVMQLNQYSLDKVAFKKFYNKTENYINDLSERNMMVLFMGRYRKRGLNGNNFPLEIPLQIKNYNVTKHLKQTLETIEDSIDIICNGNEGKRDFLIKNTIPKLKVSIKKIPSIYTNVMLAGLKILLIERMKNMFQFTDDLNPIIEVYHKEDTKYHELHFMNNSSIAKIDYELIKNGSVPYHTSGAFRDKFGERFIREIIDFDLFCSDGKWEIDIEESSINEILKKTDIFFRIPKIS